jgi:anaerobic selenocysteine-containing dehydrogenase
MGKKLGTCLLCEACCGIVVDVEGGTCTQVRGDPDDPMSRGYVCPKVVGMQDLSTDPDRLRNPLVRDGKDFREASWDEALDLAARGLARVRRRHGKDAVAVYQGNPTAHNLGLLTLGQLVWRTLGTKNLYSASSVDQVPHMRAAYEMFGHVFFMPVPDIDRTMYLLVLGANPAVSNGSIMTAPDVKARLAAILARGGKVTVVDPRRTETADIATEHVFVRPGTDALLLFSLLHVIFAEGLGKVSELPMAGRDALAELAARFAPERTHARTGVDAGVVRRLARDFAAAKSAVCYPRVGTCLQEHGTLTSWLAYALAAVTGNMDTPGGLMWTTPAADLVAVADLLGAAGVGRFRTRVRGLPETGGELPVAALSEEIEAFGPGQIRALVTSAGNPVLSTPNGKRLERALGTLEHMVSIDGYVNETTRHAHVILPPCAPLSRAHYDLALNAFAVRNVAKWVDPPVPPSPGEKDDGEIALLLGQRLRLPLPGLATLTARFARDGKLAERMVDTLLRVGPYGLGRGGLSVAKLREHPHGIDLGPLVPGLRRMLRTASKRVELAPAPFVREVAALEATLLTPAADLVLIGRRHLRSNNSWLHNSARLVKGPRRCTLLVSPEDAAERGLRAGDRARVTSVRGAVEAPVEISDEIMPGVVSLPHGFGHTREGARLSVAGAAENAGVSLNDLTDDARVDRLTGNAALNGVAVVLARVEVEVDEGTRPRPRIAAQSEKSLVR